MPKSLSAREMEVVQQVMKGLPNKDIAEALGVVDATVKVHVKTILYKLRLKNRTQLALWGHGIPC